MKVADIKCFCKGTNSNSFLKEENYSGVISDLSTITSSLDNSETTLKGEMTGGGLDAAALNLGGFSPLFEMGYNATKNISSANSSVSEIKEIIESDAKTHMTNEWGKFYQETYKCTEERKKEMDNKQSRYSSIANNENSTQQQINSAYKAYSDAKDDYEVHVKKLESIKGSYESLAGTGSASAALEMDFEKMASNSTNTGGGTYPTDGSTNRDVEASVYEELVKLGYSRAGICAILANMQQESAHFQLTAIGDGGSSFGLCQWHDEGNGRGRWTNLINFCEQNGLDPNTVQGQVAFLDYELKNDYSDLYNKLKNADDSQETAQELAKRWCIEFERPKNAQARANERAGYVGTYWEKSEGVNAGASVVSGYTNLSNLDKSNKKKTQAVKTRDYDTTMSTGQSATAQNVSSQIAEYAINHCPGTTGWCAGAVERAVTGVTGIDTSGNAKDLLTNNSLERAGYVKLDIDPASSSYQPVPGDVVVCDGGYRSLDGKSGGYSTFGHAQVYTNDGWYSDHKQDNIYLYSNTNAVYRYKGT